MRREYQIVCDARSIRHDGIEHAAELARQGGLARAKALTPKQRRDSAIKASKAAAKVRTKKAKAKKQGNSGSKET